MNHIGTEYVPHLPLLAQPSFGSAASSSTGTNSSTHASLSIILNTMCSALARSCEHTSSLMHCRKCLLRLDRHATKHAPTVTHYRIQPLWPWSKVMQHRSAGHTCIHTPPHQIKKRTCGSRERVFSLRRLILVPAVMAQAPSIWRFLSRLASTSFPVCTSQPFYCLSTHPTISRDLSTHAQVSKYNHKEWTRTHICTVASIQTYWHTPTNVNATTTHLADSCHARQFLYVRVRHLQYFCSPHHCHQPYL